MTVSPLPARGGIHADVRDDGRTVRVAAHAAEGMVTMSLWRGDRCIGSHRMGAADVPRLITLLAEALVAATGAPATVADPAGAQAV